MLKRQQAVRAADEATNPEACVTAGSAKIPAPTVVPATRAAAPSTVPGSCRSVSGLRFEKRRGLLPLLLVLSTLLVPLLPLQTGRKVVNRRLLPTPTG